MLHASGGGTLAFAFWYCYGFRRQDWRWFNCLRVDGVDDFACEECDHALLECEFHFLPPRILVRVRRLAFPIRRLVVAYSMGLGLALLVSMR